MCWEGIKKKICREWWQSRGRYILRTWCPLPDRGTFKLGGGVPDVCGLASRDGQQGTLSFSSVCLLPFSFPPPTPTPVTVASFGEATAPCSCSLCGGADVPLLPLPCTSLHLPARKVTLTCCQNLLQASLPPSLPLASTSSSSTQYPALRAWMYGPLRCPLMLCKGVFFLVMDVSLVASQRGEKKINDSRHHNASVTFLIVINW